MIHVFADHIHAGTLAKEAGKPYYVFTYHPEVDQDQSVSLTMPVRLKSYVSSAGSLHPIFDMNLPEGFLRNYLMKAVPNCDDLKLKELEHGIKYLDGFYDIGQKISEQWEQGLLT